ncbi:MAG: DUF4193 family protein [Actinobacteria bacterium]|nr:DUF4193 family protein [Actinomycetota bacterium]
MAIEDPEVAEEVEETASDDSEEETDVDPSQIEASYEEVFTKRAEGEDDEEESLLEMTREERLESLSVRAVPRQSNEFVCSNCHLVKHNSQLADRRRKLCRDCV